MEVATFESVLHHLVSDLLDSDYYDEDDNIVDTKSVSTFKEAGMLTDDAGLVVRMADGSEFQIIVRSR